MESFAFLQTIIGTERALVITCLECCFEIEQQHPGFAFRYTTLGNMINPSDTLQRETIHRFIEFKGCTKIIVAGHKHCKALEFILKGVSSQPYLYDAQIQLKNMLENNHHHLVKKEFTNRMLVELNVIEQCKTLMNYDCLRERIERGELSVIGLVITPDGHDQEVFRNGIEFNHGITMN